MAKQEGEDECRPVVADVAKGRSIVGFEVEIRYGISETQKIEKDKKLFH